MLRVTMETLVRLNAHIQPFGSAFRQSVCLSQTEKEEKATVILSPGDFKQTVDRVKALTVCHVFSVASRALAVDFAARLKGA